MNIKTKRFKKLMCCFILIVMILTLFDLTAKTANASSRTVKQVYEEENIKITFDITAQWAGAFNGNIIIENLSNETIHNWIVGFDFPHEITKIWNGEVVENKDGKTIIRNSYYNQDIKPGKSISFGFTGKYEDIIEAPVNCKLLNEEKEVESDNYEIEFNVLKDWGLGYTGEFKITNVSDVTIEDWKLGFDFETTFDKFWTAKIISSEKNLHRIMNTDSNANIKPGETLVLGFNARLGNINSEPKNYVLTEVVMKEFFGSEMLDVSSLRIQEKVMLSWKINEEYSYCIEKGSTPDALTIIESEYSDNVYNDLLSDNKEESYYRVSAFKDGVEVAKSNIIAILEDSDNDGLSDKEELMYGTDINNPDTDLDGLGDYLEVYSFKTDPLVKDTDGDNLNDYDEIRCDTNPLLKDTDGNGITDDLEDADADGLNNYEEILFGSDPSNEDTDFDELDDKKEKELGTDPNNLDTDNDGLLDGKEIELGTDPLNKDSNGNGILDGDEIFNISQSVEGEELDENVVPHINIPLKATQIDTLNIEKIPEDDIFLSSDIPGYIGSGYDFTVDGTFDSASLTYEFNSELLNNEGFEPRIYYFNKETQVLEELENQVVEGNKVTATITHFSKYILLNKVEFDKVWENEIKPPSDESEEKILEIAFAIDISYSMSWNDSEWVRKDVTKKFIENLREEDRAALISFRRIAEKKCILTSDKGMLNNAINGLFNDDGYSSYSGTNGSAGIKEALETLKKSDRDSIKYIVFLTDGEDTTSSFSYDNLIQEAKDNNVVIYTIGLGQSFDNALLRKIATGTEGKYYHASTAGDLVGEFDKVTDETIDFVTDSDNDGISDYYENAINGGILRLGTGKSLAGKLDPNNSDVDGDGLLDGEELVITKIGNKVYAKYNSDPTKKDTDYDGYNDYEEKKNGTDALVWDISHRDLAMCADIVYHDLPSGTKFDNKSWKDIINNRLGDKARVEELKDWSVEDTHYSYGGLEAATYKKDNNLIVAYRGSESNDWIDIVQDWVYADGLGWLTGFNIQAPAAKSFIARVMKENPGYNIYVTGHSLGGNLAYNSASKAISIDSNRFKALTVYNALGLLQGAIGDGAPHTVPGIFDIDDAFNIVSMKDRVYAYRVEGDIVSKLPLTFHYGNKIEFEYSSDLPRLGYLPKPKEAHSLYSIFESINPLGRF